MRIIQLALVAVMTVSSAACFQSSAIVKVNADGSGTIEHQMLMTTAAIARMRQLVSAFNVNGQKPFDPISEQDARDLAGKMGEGVTLVSSTPLKNADGEGRQNVYAFRDITKLRLDETPTPGGSSVRAGGVDVGHQTKAITVDLARSAEGHALLTLHAPDPILQFNVGGGAGTSTVNADQLAMAREMLAGLRVSVRVQPAGRLIRTSSPFVDGQTVTLIEADLDQILKDERALTRLQSAKTPDERLAALKDTPGLKVALGDITIEFAAR